MQSSLSKPVLGVLFVALLALTVFFISLDRAKMVKSELQVNSSVFALSVTETLRLSVENLQTLSNVIVYFEDINHDQFKGVAGQYFEADPSLLILEWQPIVEGSDREQFENRIRNSGIENFRLWEPDTNGAPVMAAERAQHVPVLYLLSRNPSGDDVNTLGLDLAWSPERMESKLQARDLGRARVSNLFRVVTGQHSDYDPLGFAITLPVYEGGIVPLEPTQRKDKLIGYMAGVYSVEELTKNQTEKLLDIGFNVLIRDQFDNDNRLVMNAGEPSQYHTEKEISAYGSSLYFTLTATRDFTNRQFHILWLVLPCFLLLFGVIIFLFLRRLEAKNQKLNEALHQLENALKEVEALKKREKENIYRATIHGTQHIMNNLVNQLTLVSMEIGRHNNFNPKVVDSFEKMKVQAIQLVDQLSSVKEIDEQTIKDSIRPK